MSFLLFFSTASDALQEVAQKWISKLSVKNGSYPPDSYPNPGRPSHSDRSLALRHSHTDLTALAYHNVQLEASAFREEFDPDEFEDLTLPKYAGMTKVRYVWYT